MTCTRSWTRGTSRAEHRPLLLVGRLRGLPPDLVRHLPELSDLLVEGVQELWENLVDRKEHGYELDPIPADAERVELGAEDLEPLLDNVLYFAPFLIGQDDAVGTVCEGSQDLLPARPCGRRDPHHPDAWRVFHARCPSRVRGDVRSY